MHTAHQDFPACFEYEVKYNGDPLIKNGTKKNNYGKANDALACRGKCLDTSGCGWFNWDKDGFCWLNKNKGTKENEPTGVSGPRSCEEGKN